MSRAVVIDDSKAIRMILKKTLADLGYEVAQAGNGREALDLFQNDPGGFSLALVDWNMPEMSGLEFVKRLRSEPRFSSVVLMMVTTETQVEQMVAALDAGANEYVMKPFTREIIEDKLRLLGLLA
jgi:two-component system chemotaxis response regulator CheY